MQKSCVFYSLDTETTHGVVIKCRLQEPPTPTSSLTTTPSPPTPSTHTNLQKQNIWKWNMGIYILKTKPTKQNKPQLEDYLSKTQNTQTQKNPTHQKQPHCQETILNQNNWFHGKRLKSFGIHSDKVVLPIVKVKVTHSCPTLGNPMDYTVHGILQARLLGQVAIPFSRGSSQPRDRTHVSHIAGRFFTS